MPNITGLRIKNARKLKQLSQQELADEIGVSKQMISKYEKGLSLPDSSKLLLLSKVFDQKVDYFFRSFNVDLGQVNFRKRSNFSIKKENSLKELVKIKLENYISIEETLSLAIGFENPIKNDKIKSLKDIEKVVGKIRKYWKIGIDPLHNIIQLLEDNGIKVIELENVDLKFDGLATIINEKYPVIVINKKFPIERKRFTLLHELGHLLLNLPACEISKEEKFCNKFAAEFLLPLNIILKEYGGKRQNITLPELISTQKKYGMSIPAIIYRLVDAKILSTDRHRKFYQKINFNPSLKKEINASRFETPENSSRYESLVYRALSEEHISLSKASALLNISLETVKENFTSI